jgi:hypothetical protein
VRLEQLPAATAWCYVPDLQLLRLQRKFLHPRQCTAYSVPQPPTVELVTDLSALELVTLLIISPFASTAQAVSRASAL